MVVYEKNGGYTDKASELDCKVHKVLDCVIKEAIEDGMKIEEILYIIDASAKFSALRYQIEKKIKL